ncbi:hypothetical protein [Streptomyces bacillaris]|uniref:hypothetical protein n=1 Tax=Streptomyces bacillaris TaxID=68179 RepID=UPI00345F6849
MLVDQAWMGSHVSTWRRVFDALHPVLVLRDGLASRFVVVGDGPSRGARSELS